MQKLLSCFAFSFLAFFLQVAAPDCFGTKLAGSALPTIFQDDLSSLDCELSRLTELEQWVEKTNMTQSQLQETGNPLAQYVLQEGDISASLFGSSAPDHEQLMDIPGFLWGFCCSFIGMVLVYLSIDDPIAKKKEGKQAIIGCAAGTILWVGLYIWLVVSLSF